MLLKSFKEMINSFFCYNKNRFFKKFILNCNSINCDLNNTFDIINIKKKKEKVLLEIADKIIEKANAK